MLPSTSFVVCWTANAICNSRDITRRYVVMPKRATLTVA